jgi:hypothetical protein
MWNIPSNLKRGAAAARLLRIECDQDERCAPDLNKVNLNRLDLNNYEQEAYDPFFDLFMQRVDSGNNHEGLRRAPCI